MTALGESDVADLPQSTSMQRSVAKCSESMAMVNLALSEQQKNATLKVTTSNRIKLGKFV